MPEQKNTLVSHKPFPIFGLPPEIRHSIWCFVVIVQQQIVVRAGPITPSFNQPGNLRNIEQQRAISKLSPAFTCRQLYHEITPIYYSRNTFQILATQPVASTHSQYYNNVIPGYPGTIQYSGPGYNLSNAFPVLAMQQSAQSHYPTTTLPVLATEGNAQVSPSKFLDDIGRDKAKLITSICIKGLDSASVGYLCLFPNLRQASIDYFFHFDFPWSIILALAEYKNTHPHLIMTLYGDLADPPELNKTLNNIVSGRSMTCAWVDHFTHSRRLWTSMASTEDCHELDTSKLWIGIDSAMSLRLEPSIMYKGPGKAHGLCYTLFGFPLQ